MWNDAEIVGRTPIGRTKIEVLRINLPERIEHRQRLHKQLEPLCPGNRLLFWIRKRSGKTDTRVLQLDRHAGQV